MRSIPELRLKFSLQSLLLLTVLLGSSLTYAWYKNSWSLDSGFVQSSSLTFGSFSVLGDKVFLIVDRGGAIIWNIAARQHTPIWNPMTSNPPVAYDLSLDSLAIAYRNGLIKLFDSTNQTIRSVNTGSNISAVSQFGTDVFFVSSGGIKVWDSVTGVITPFLIGGIWKGITIQKKTGQILISTNGGYSILFSQQRTVIGKIAGDRGVFAPDGALLATVVADKSIHIFDTKSGAEVGILYGHTGSIWTLKFSPLSQSLLSYGDDWIIKVWDIKTYSLKTSSPSAWSL